MGIQVLTSRGDVGRGIVLVDKNGKPCSDGSTVTVQMKNCPTSSALPQKHRGNSSSSVSGSRRSSASSSAAAADAFPVLSDASNELLIQYGLMALGALVVLKIVSAAVNMLSILLLPAVYLYASANCPSNESFEAKKELKRVMRGAHLPAEHQPKGFFEQGLNRLAASVTAEIATSLGYDIGVTDYFGAAKMTCVTVPVAGAEYYWLGIFGTCNVGRSFPPPRIAITPLQFH